MSVRDRKEFGKLTMKIVWLVAASVYLFIGMGLFNFSTYFFFNRFNNPPDYAPLTTLAVGAIVGGGMLFFGAREVGLTLASIRDTCLRLRLTR